MKGRLLRMAWAASLAAGSMATAGGLEIYGISPPGAGQPGSTGHLDAVPLSVFGGTPATSGNANSMSSGDLASLVTSVNPLAGMVYVFTVNYGPQTSIVVLAGGTLQTSVLTNTGGTGAFQTGGVNIGQLSGGGFSSVGTLNAIGGVAAFAYVGMPHGTTGSVTIFGNNSAGFISRTATVQFLSWNASSSSFNVATSTQMNGSLSFQFHVNPVPAPLALSAVALAGAVALRRRMLNTKH